MVRGTIPFPARGVRAAWGKHPRAWLRGCLVAVLGSASLAASAAAAAEHPASRVSADDPPRSVNLHRVKVLFDGNARAIWVGDSWSTFQSLGRMPYGSLLVWPIGELRAFTTAFRPGVMGVTNDYTSGDGRLIYVEHDRYWTVDYDAVQGQQYFALPVFDIAKVWGRDGLNLGDDAAWSDMPLIHDHSIRNNRLALGELPPFSGPDDHILCRPLYYAPYASDNLLSHARFADRDGTRFGAFDLRHHARPYWHRGQTPGVTPPRRPVSSQINALATDLPLNGGYLQGPGLMIGEDPDHPFVGTETYWMSAGAVYYHADEQGVPLPGYYHSGLAAGSWSFAGMADDTRSTGGKNFSDEQLVHWLDVTTLDRTRTPVIVLHIATEDKEPAVIEQSVRRIIERYRGAYSQIGAAPPRFLLVGSFMHDIRERPIETARQRVQELDVIYAHLAKTEPDCAFFSLYEATDGTFFSVDYYGGPGTQQAARDWLDNNGWSEITFGGVSYTLSSRANDGLDGVLLFDGLHSNYPQAAAFYAKLVGDAIAASSCPGDFNGDGNADTLDVLAFLNAWNAGDNAADTDGNGTLDTRDVLAFLNAWNEGC